MAAPSDYFGADFFDISGPFYSRVTYGLGGPVISIVRGVEIQLDL